MHVVRAEQLVQDFVDKVTAYLVMRTLRRERYLRFLMGALAIPCFARLAA